jgi:hypothetical protein
MNTNGLDSRETALIQITYLPEASYSPFAGRNFTKSRRLDTLVPQGVLTSSSSSKCNLPMRVHPTHLSIVRNREKNDTPRTPVRPPPPSHSHALNIAKIHIEGGKEGF